LSCTPSSCRLQKDKQAAELVAAEARGKAAAEVEAVQGELAAAEQRVSAAKVGLTLPFKAGAQTPQAT
jgi:hypothetical protein